MAPLSVRIQRHAIYLIVFMGMAAATVIVVVTQSDRGDLQAYQRVEREHLAALTTIANLNAALATAQRKAREGHARPLDPQFFAMRRNLDKLAALSESDLQMAALARINQRLERAAVDEKIGATGDLSAHFDALELYLTQLYRLHTLGVQRESATLTAQRTEQRRTLWLMVGAMALLVALMIGRILVLMKNSIEQQACIERELKESRERIHQMQKVEALGQLVGGVAHDFNNLMTAVLGNAQLLLMSDELDDGHRRGLQQIESAAERAAALTRQLLTFSRRQNRTPTIVDFNALLREAMPRLRNMVGADRELRWSIGDDIATVRMDAGQLETTVVELLSNARDASGPGDRITLTTANVTVAADHPAVAVLGQGRFCRLCVEDSGRGMNADTMARVFEPFFTTKARGDGKGLGLSAAHGIVQSNDGHILVESTPEKGTRVDVWLPLAEPPALQTTSPESLVGSETILIVDDEVSILDLVAAGLTQLGYRVLVATNGQEALALCEAHDHAIDMIVTDVVMPGLSGPQVVQRVTKIRPQIIALLMSGYADDVLAQQGHDTERFSLIDKPFHLNALAATIRRALDSRPLAS